MVHKYKVGDKVVITNNKKAWNSEMDKYDGRVVIITKVVEWTGGDVSILFDGSGPWNWSTQHNHFKPFEGPEETYEIF